MNCRVMLFYHAFYKPWCNISNRVLQTHKNTAAVNTTVKGVVRVSEKIRKIRDERKIVKNPFCFLSLWTPQV